MEMIGFIPLVICFTCSAVRSQKLEIVKIPRLVVAGIQDTGVWLNLTAEVFVNTTGTNRTDWPVNNLALTYSNDKQFLFTLDVTKDPCNGSRNSFYLTCQQAKQNGYNILVNYPYFNYYVNYKDYALNGYQGYLMFFWTGRRNTVKKSLYLYNYDVDASQTVTITTNLSTSSCLGKLHFEEFMVDLYVNTTSYGPFDENELGIYVSWSPDYFCQILIHKRECTTIVNNCGYCVNVTDNGYLIRLNITVSQTWYKPLGFTISARWNNKFTFGWHHCFELIEWLQAETEVFLFYQPSLISARLIIPGPVSDSQYQNDGTFSLKLAAGDQFKMSLADYYLLRERSLDIQDIDKDIVLTLQRSNFPKETYICNSFAQLCDPVTFAEHLDIVRVTLTCQNSSGPNYLLIGGKPTEATSVRCQSQNQCHTWVFDVDVDIFYRSGPFYDWSTFIITNNNFGCRRIKNIESKPVIENCPKGDDVIDGYIRVNSPASCTCRMESNSPYSTALVQWMTSDDWQLTELGKIVVINVTDPTNSDTGYSVIELKCTLADYGELLQYITYKPKFYEIPTVKEVTVNGSDVITADPGTAVRLYCRVDGLPSAIAVITGSGLGRVKENRSESYALEIVLSDLQCRDSGRYYCWGSNGFETNQSRRQKFVDVNVNCSPKLKNETAVGEVQTVMATANSDTSVVMEIYGYPQPTDFQLKTETGNVIDIKKYKVTYSNLTPPLGLVNLTIYDAEVKVTMNYILTIRNEVGESDVRMQVIKQEIRSNNSQNVDKDSSLDSQNMDKDTALIIGVVVGVIIVLIAVAVAAIYIYRRRTANKGNTNRLTYSNNLYTGKERQIVDRNSVGKQKNVGYQPAEDQQNFRGNSSRKQNVNTEFSELQINVHRVPEEESDEMNNVGKEILGLVKNTHKEVVQIQEAFNQYKQELELEKSNNILLESVMNLSDDEDV